MLKLLRKKKVSKKIFYGLAILIIPAFVIWGSSSVINKNKTPNYAGRIFDRQVSYDEFSNAHLAWETQLKLQYGEKAREAAKTYFNPIQATWDRLILLHETRQRNIKISDADVITAITHMPFLEKGDRFDPQAYDLFAKYSLGITPRTFEEQLRENLAMAFLFEDITKNVGITDEEVRKEYEHQNVQTRVKYVAFLAKDYKDKTSVSDDEIKSTFEKSKEKFKVPPQINASYVTIEFKENTPAEEKTKANEKLKHCLALAKTKGFKEATQETGLEVKETGLFGFEDPIPGLGWMPQVSGLLFDLPSGAFSKIIELSRGTYLFKIKEKKDAYLPEFAEAKNKVKETLILKKSEEVARQKAQEYLSKINEAVPASSFEKIAQENHLTVKETPLFAHDGYIPELGMAESLKEAAFKLKKGEVLKEVMELEQGFYVLKSLETVPFDEEKYKKEKDDFAKQLLDQKRTKVFNEFFTNLRNHANLVNYITETQVK
jgi:peptidyl-prolyl cis-trans isomerase D